MKPPLRWVGGKSALAPYLLSLLPADVHERRWVEPFAGGAGMFWALQPGRAWLSDANLPLMNFYRHLRSQSPRTFYSAVSAVAERYNADPEHDYYRVRDRLRTFQRTLEDAAHFWLLNKCGYNGLWRVNQRGEMNTPWGKRPTCPVPVVGQFGLWHSQLKNVTISHDNHGQVLPECQSDDFVFIDPPYDAGFTAYTADGFGILEQYDLGNYVRGLSCRDIPFMLTNANTPLIRRIYADLNIVEIEAPRRVAANGDRKPAKEVVVTNYSLEELRRTAC